MKQSLFACIAATLLMVSTGAEAITLSFDPPTQNVGLGPVDVNVVISDLGNNAPPSLGAFDLDISFNDAILDFTGLMFGDPILGNQLDLTPPPLGPFGTINGFVEDPNPAVGLVDFFEISLDAPSVLDSLQPDSFVLATLSFNVVAGGLSPLNFTSIVLSDSLGNTLQASTSSGLIGVPEPAPIFLFVAGLAGVGLVAQRRKALASQRVLRWHD
jgi:hypothetical protein